MRKFFIYRLSNPKITGMNCRKAKRLLFFLADQSLGDEQAHSVKLHLDNCNDCKKLYEAMVGFTEIMDKRTGPAVNPFFVSCAEHRLSSVLDAKSNTVYRFARGGLVRTIPVISSIILAIAAGIAIGYHVAEVQQVNRVTLDNPTTYWDYLYPPLLTVETIESILISNGNNN